MFMPRKKLGVVILVNGTTDIHYVKSLAHDAMIRLWENKTASKYIPKINTPNRSIIGFKIKKSHLSHGWENVLGEYINYSVNMTLVLKIENGHLQRVWKKDGNEIFSEFVKVVNDSESIIDNLIAKSRVTLRKGLDKNGKFFVEHQGLSFTKRE